MLGASLPAPFQHGELASRRRQGRGRRRCRFVVTGQSAGDVFVVTCGADNAIRTRDLSLTKGVLYRWSYISLPSNSIRGSFIRRTGEHSWMGATHGGGIQSRTGLGGFAIHCITALLCRLEGLQCSLAERAGFEPATELPLCHLSRVVT